MLEALELGQAPHTTSSIECCLELSFLFWGKSGNIHAQRYEFELFKMFHSISVITPYTYNPNCMLKITEPWGKIVSGKSRQNLYNFPMKAPRKRITTRKYLDLVNFPPLSPSAIISWSFAVLTLQPNSPLTDVSHWRHLLLLETSFIQTEYQVLVLIQEEMSG